AAASPARARGGQIRARPRFSSPGAQGARRLFPGRGRADAGARPSVGLGGGRDLVPRSGAGARPRARRSRGGDGALSSMLSAFGDLLIENLAEVATPEG